MPGNLMHVIRQMVAPEVPAVSTCRIHTETRASGLRFNLSEAAGGLGDLGVFIPLLVGMVNRCGLQLEPALFLAGAMNIATGLLFQIPMPVQPMKAIAAVAIAEGLNEAQILAAGIICGRRAPRARHYRVDGLVKSESFHQRSPWSAVGARVETRL